MSSEVCSFKVITGEEIIAQLVSTSFTDGAPHNTIYKIRRPHVLKFQQIGPGQVGLTLVPWTLSHPSIDLLDLKDSMVVVKFSPDANCEKEYLQLTSGIALA